MNELVNVLLGPVPDGEQLVRISARLLAAVVLGAVVGVQRELESKPAGLRTHVLVTLAAAIFVIVPLEVGMPIGDLSRVIQGVATGIGFIGAGAILKLYQDREIHGLTTAATLWMATAIGIAVGLGYVLVAALSVGLTWIVLSVMVRIDAWITSSQSRAEDYSRGAAERASKVPRY
jgi:putative Mg2+ transporter-C (MgtC) family protein